MRQVAAIVLVTILAGAGRISKWRRLPTDLTPKPRLRLSDGWLTILTAG